MRGEVTDCRAAVEKGVEAAADGAAESLTETTYCTVPYLAMEGGQALLVAGDAAAAVQLLSTAAQQWPGGQDRDRGLCLARLAHAYIDADEPEAACSIARQALASLDAARSARTEGTLRRLRGRLLTFRRRPDVTDLRDELARAV